MFFPGCEGVYLQASSPHQPCYISSNFMVITAIAPAPCWETHKPRTAATTSGEMHSARRIEHKDPLQETFLTSSALMRHNWVNDEGELKTSLASLPQSMSMMEISVESQKRVYPNVVWIHLELYPRTRVYSYRRTYSVCIREDGDHWLVPSAMRS